MADTRAKPGMSQGISECGIPSASPRATPRCPGGKPGKLGQRLAADVAPRGTAWSGMHQADGCHTTAKVQDRCSGPSLGRETSRSSEKPGEVARAFLLVDPAASLPLAQVAECGADELACKPNPVAVRLLASVLLWRFVHVSLGFLTE